MAYPVYSPSAFGDVEGAATPTKAESEAAIRSMRRSLKGWLKFRKKVDEAAAGVGKASRFRNPGAKPLPPSVVRSTLREERFTVEQDLATQLHTLLMEAGFSSQALPQPNVAVDPNAAVKLAEIAINGKLPSEVGGPQAQGIVWFVLAIPVAGIVLIISQAIKSKADVAKHQAEMHCIEIGKCTDSGFWLKVGSIAVLGWLAWDKFGLKEAVAKRKK